MKPRALPALVALCGACLTLTPTSHGQRQMEHLGRGVVAINQGDGKVFVSCRLLGTEVDDIAFNLYRATGGAAAVKLNKEPLVKATCFLDTDAKLEQPTAYFVRAVLAGKEQEQSAAFKFAANAPARPYLSIALKDGGGTPNDASVGGLDGDGEYEIILKRENGARDNSQSGMTGDTELRIHTTTIPTEHRLYTLMHDAQYRVAIAWQNVGYNQPPHPGFFLGHGMKLPQPRPNITTQQIEKVRP